MLFIDQSKVRDILTMETCMAVMKKALMDLAKDEATQQLRSVFPLNEKNVFGQMPGFLKNEGVFGTKVITVFPDNYKRALSSHQGLVLLFDAENGTLKATVDGSEITAIRTAAVSGVATDVLARKDADTLSLLGSGEQARSHLEAMLFVRPIKRVKIWSRNKENGIAFKNDMEHKFKIKIEVCETVEEAVYHTDIICTVTAATNPILEGAWVKEGVHINAVGACLPTHRELDSNIVKKSNFYVDSIESAVNESGDYLIPLKEKVITDDHIIGEIGELLIGKIEGRTSDRCVTIFDSLGLAIEDIAAANFIYKEFIKKTT